jgi:organic radical activating enzyme
MRIVEVFTSIQGEGGFMGMPATFIRTMGCNLKCDFCDTKKSWKPGEMVEGEDLTLDEIVAKVPDNITLVVITGGEPTIQPQLGNLIDKLHLADKHVAVETNGTMEVDGEVDWVTCSPKADANYIINSFCRPNELKYVVTPDFDPAVITEPIRKLYAGRIWLQPEGSDIQNMWKRCYEIAMADPRLRVGVQLHKLMEVE